MKVVPAGIEEGKYFAHGAWDPGHRFWGYGQHLTFSIGVYQAIPKTYGKGLKASKCIVRVEGYTAQPEAVREKAAEIVRQLEAGTYRGVKTVKVKFVPGLPDARKEKHGR